jgi:hypothetical protein
LYQGGTGGIQITASRNFINAVEEGIAGAVNKNDTMKQNFHDPIPRRWFLTFLPVLSM